MEKVLKLYTYLDGVNDSPFPSLDNQIEVYTFRCDYKRMGATPSITCTVMCHDCLDNLWTDNVYAEFNGEKFFLKQTPTSSYDNTDSRYKHELELVSERIILDNVYFYDVVDSDEPTDKPVSNSSKFTFFGTINEFAQRLNQSLEYSKVGYHVVVDDGISSEGKLISFENQFFSNALQEAYNTYEIPYYFVGKEIHIGFTDNAITHTFKYGVDESLLSIQKQNANNKIVNRITGVGSTDNIPYYYPNDYESKAEVEANGGVWVNPQTNLMPPIYRESNGSERFYNALNDTYISPQTGTYYSFENQYIDGKPKEHIVNFENIKPSIVGITNALGYRIDMFKEFAYDLNDNDETDDEGNYLHPYFFGKLKKFDGEFGFNLFDHAIDENEMVISMTSGSCGSCEFVIGVNDDQKNTVQVDNGGYLIRDNDGNVQFGNPQDKQNDTRNNEVWIALRKDINTFGVIMPNATNSYKPSTNDTFVILHIDLPKSYILSAENKLKEELIKYMAMNNSEKFNFSITFSRIFFAEHPEILKQLNENSRIQIEYNNERYELYISSFSYSMSNDKPLPEIKVELKDTITIQQNALQHAISDVKQDIMSSVGNVDYLKQGLKYFLRKDVNDRSKGKISSDKGFEVGKFEQGTLGTGASMYEGEDKNTYIEADFLKIRKKATFTTITVQELKHVGGEIILSPAAMICSKVEETELGYKCYFNTEDSDGRKIYNEFEVGDFARCQTFNLEHNKYYWRYVSEVGKDYIVLSKFDCYSNSDIPEAGDNISQLGNRYDKERQNAIVLSAYGEDAPSYKQYEGINEYALSEGMLVTKLSPKGNMLKGDFISQSTGKNIEQEFKELGVDIDIVKSQVDKEFTIWFFDYEPTLENYPASEWVTEELLIMHEQDIFYNRESGRAYRFISGSWIEITDADTLRAIEKANNAQQSANNAQQSADNAQQSANNAQQSADNAQQSANNAQQSADNAQQSANEAKQKAEAITLVVEEVISDGVLSSLEKKNVLRDFESIMAEYNRNMSSLTIFGLTIEDATVSKYHNSYISLGTYMNGGISWDGNSIPSWLTNISVNQPINSSEYRAYWSSYTDSYVEFMSYLSEIAKNKADNANKRIDEIVSDGILSALEKKEVLKEWEEVSSSYSINLTNALKYGISIDSYQTAYLELGTYLNGGSWDGSSTPKWLVEDKNQPIDSATYRSVWVAYYNEESDLLNRVSDAINKNASSKKRVFTSQPTNDSVYDVGDLWVNATYSNENVSYNDDMLVCITSKLKGEPFSINHWRPSTGITKSYIERLDESITLAVTNSNKGIEEAKAAASEAAKSASDAAKEALNALGVANTASGKADVNTAAIELLDERITAVVQGITYDENGDIKNLSALVLENSFASLFNERIQLDTDGNVLNINTAGFVTATGDDTSFASLFAKSVAADGNIVKQAQITSFVTYSELGDPYSGVVVAADNINFYGKTVINGKFIVDANGNITMNDFTANNGVFNGEINAEKGTITGNLTVGSGSVPLVIQPSNSDGYPSLVWNSSSQTYLSVGVYYSGGYAAGQIFAANNNGESVSIYPNDIHVIGASRRTYIQGGLLSFDGVTIQKDTSGILQIYASKWPVENNNKSNYMYVDGDGYVKVKNPTRG